MIDVDKFISVVRAAERTNQHFYHFTDDRNISSIKKNGLLSMQQLRKRGISIDYPGGNDWSLDADRQSGMDRYVHLCFWKQHPMEYLARKEGRIGSSTFLSLRLEVLKIPGVLITDDVANKSGVIGATPQKMLEKIDLKVVYTKTDWRDPDVKKRLLASRKYEVLVPDHVPTEYIERWS